MQKDEKHMKADEIHLGVEESYQNAIRVMLRKRKHTWSAERSEILIREHHIDVVKGTWPLDYQTYQVRLRTRELKQVKSKSSWKPE